MPRPLIAPNCREIVAARRPALCAQGPPVGRLGEHARDRRVGASDDRRLRSGRAGQIICSGVSGSTVDGDGVLVG
jgi:hypothetical protein